MKTCRRYQIALIIRYEIIQNTQQYAVIAMLITTASRTSNAIMIVLTVISRADLKHLNLKD